MLHIYLNPLQRKEQFSNFPYIVPALYYALLIVSESYPNSKYQILLFQTIYHFLITTNLQLKTFKTYSFFAISRYHSMIILISQFTITCKLSNPLCSHDVLFLPISLNSSQYRFQFMPNDLHTSSTSDSSERPVAGVSATDRRMIYHIWN